MSALPSYLEVKDKDGNSKFLKNIDELFLNLRRRNTNMAALTL
jgi:hypothetical protein